jgi:hypothetical protein
MSGAATKVYGQSGDFGPVNEGKIRLYSKTLKEAQSYLTKRFLHKTDRF